MTLRIGVGADSVKKGGIERKIRIEALAVQRAARVDRSGQLVVSFIYGSATSLLRNSWFTTWLDAPERWSFTALASLSLTDRDVQCTRTTKTLIWLGVGLGVLAAIPLGAWFSLTYEPYYYRAMVGLSREQSAGRAKKFVAQSLQLRNDICNEPNWEAVFTDQEVNAWLAEDLVTHFADRLPPEVHEPRLLFEPDRIILAFQLRQGGVQSVITVVARPRVPGGNTIELTLEKIRAGFCRSRPTTSWTGSSSMHARHGVDAEWARKDGYPVVVMRYTPHIDREDVQLEELQIRDHQIRLAGRSDRAKGRFLSTNPPSWRVLQSKFPAPKAPRFALATRVAGRRSTSPTS